MSNTNKIKAYSHYITFKKEKKETIFNSDFTNNKKKVISYHIQLNNHLSQKLSKLNNIIIFFTLIFLYCLKRRYLMNII